MTENSTTPEGTADNSNLNTESTSQLGEFNIKEAAERSLKQNLNKRQNSIDDAMRQAEFNNLKKPSTISLDDMSSLELPDESKGVDYKRVVETLPDDAKQLLGNLRADYTRKTQALAQQQKELEARMKALTESDFFKKTQEIANSQQVELDPYDIQSFETRIQQEVAKRMNEMFQPIQEQQQIQMKQLKFQEFKQAHPDMDSLKVEIANELTANHALSLQDAYFIAKGKVSAKRLAEIENERAYEKENARNIGLKIGTPRDSAPGRPPAGLSGYELYTWFERNPGKISSQNRKK